MNQPAQKIVAVILSFVMLANFVFISANQALALDAVQPAQTAAAGITAVATSATAAGTAASAIANTTKTIKDLILDTIGSVVSDVILKRMEKNIMDWGMGKKSKIQLPFAVEDFKDYFDEFLNIASAKFLEEFKDTKLCTGLNYALGSAPQINLRTLRSNLRSTGRFSRTFSTYYVDQPSYQQANACTLQKVINNVESFIRRPRITIFGWDAWKTLNSPRNNIFGAFFSALDRKTQIAAREIMNAAQQVQAGSGYRNQTRTTANSQDACTQKCRAGTNLPACEANQEDCAELYPNVGPVTTDNGNMTECYNICGADTSFCLANRPLDYDYCDNQRERCLLSTPACAPSVAPSDSSQYELYQQCLQAQQAETTQPCQTQIQSCINNCSRIPFVPLANVVTNFGSHIQTSVQNALGKDMSRLVGVDEITELVGVFFSAILNKAINGLGLAFRSITANASQQRRATSKDKYSYQRQYLKTTSSSEKKDVRTSVYSTMEESIKTFSRSIVACDSKAMMTYQDFGKHLTDVMDGNVEALYVGVQGVNLQPDAVILDPPYAPYSVYGYSWGEIFSSKIPEKCRLTLNQMNMASNTNCSDIISGLEPNYMMTQTTTALPACNDDIDNDNDGLIDFPNDPGCLSATDTNETNITGGGLPEIEERERAVPMIDLVPGIGNVPCLPCMYDHDALSCPVGPVPPQRYPGEGNSVWTNAMLEQKMNFYQSCNEWYVVSLNRCEQCLKDYDEKCMKLETQADINNCIMQNCNNYEDIIDHVIDPPTDAMDFYGKCLIEEQKDNCLTCLKEYYVPATYCEQIRDYGARLVTKYPAVVVNKYAKDEGEFRGLFDQAISDMGGLCNDNDHAEDISLALICRALPDFSYNGQRVCATCNASGMTEAQLRDVTDFRPNEADCRNRKLPVGGQEPFDVIDQGVLDARNKCCADYWQDNRKNYTICVGSGPTTESTGPGTTTTLRATLAASPISGIAPLNNVDLTATVTGAPAGESITYNFDCNNDGTFEYSQTTTQTTLTATDRCNYAQNNTTYTASVYVMLTDLGNSTNATTTIQTTDCAITTTLNPATGIPPASVNTTATFTSSETGPFTYRFYCDVPVAGGPLTSWEGPTIEYVSTNNPFALDNACSYTTPGTRGVGVSITSASGERHCYQTVDIQETPEISCSAEVTAPSLPSTSVPVTVFTQTSPNDSYINLIQNTVGTTFSYNCGYGAYTAPVTRTGADYETAPCTYSAPGTYEITVRVGNTTAGFSAYDTCSTFVDIQGGGGVPLP